MTKPDTIKQNRKPNRLINEKSPYLLQHSYNPVNWNPWCEEAFAEAKAQDKPIFLSIGYSTCHWYHVHKRYYTLISRSNILYLKKYINIKGVITIINNSNITVFLKVLQYRKVIQDFFNTLNS